MKKFIAIVVCIFFASNLYAQAEQMPEFPGGDDSLMKFINANLKYPAIAHKKGFEKKVVIEFTIDEDGNVKDAEVRKEINFYVENLLEIQALENEALRVVRLMPKWHPGKKNGKVVKYLYQIPIGFWLEDE